MEAEYRIGVGKTSQEDSPFRNSYAEGYLSQFLLCYIETKSNSNNNS